jgi:hypothetical protein
MRRNPFLLFLLVSLAGAVRSPVHAQAPDTFLDAGAAQLLARARAFRDAADSSVLSYTGTVRSRLAAGIRMPLKDRTLYRRETASRIRWSRGAPIIIMPLALREQTPDGVSIPGMGSAPSVDEVFDPTQDRIYFGLTDKSDGDDDIWIQHPIVAGAEQYYRYKSGDTLTIHLQDGRIVRTIELRVIPRTPTGHVVSGSLWIETANGAVVQALYRLARPLDIGSEVLDAEDRADMDKLPGMFKPLVFDITLVAMEYSLYDLRYWMPRFTRLEGYLRAGVISTPAAYEISYDIDEVVTATPQTVARESIVADSVADAWRGTDHYMGVRKANGRPARMLIPFDSVGLMTSAELPPPIWKKNAEFVTDKELGSLYDRLGNIAPASPISALQPRFVWGYGASDLLRYNRVEGLSVGARVQTSARRLSFDATARLGVADLHPNLVLSATRVATRNSMLLQARHALTSVDDQTDAFGIGNSMSAVLLGRDDGEYYRTTGASLTFSPNEDERANYDVTFYAQHDNAVARETNMSLRSVWDRHFAFRPNVAATEATLTGMTVSLRPWWGSDPLRVQGGLDIMADGAVTDFQFLRARVTARAALPLGSRHRIGLEAGAGSAAGDVPPQRLWYLGGANTLRGYDGSSLVGTQFGRARIDVARTFGWGGLTLFSDAAWTGSFDPRHTTQRLYSVGVGSSLLDGLMRADIAHALNRGRQWRLELYVDALL